MTSPCPAVYILHVAVTRFLNLTAPLVKQYICNPSSVASPSRHWCVLLLFFELLCLWSFWKGETWKQARCFTGATFQLHAEGTERLWFLPAPCHSGLVYDGQRRWIHLWAIAHCDFTFNLLHTKILYFFSSPQTIQFCVNDSIGMNMTTTAIINFSLTVKGTVLLILLQPGCSKSDTLLFQSWLYDIYFQMLVSSLSSD